MRIARDMRLPWVIATLWLVVEELMVVVDGIPRLSLDGMNNGRLG